MNSKQRTLQIIKGFFAANLFAFTMIGLKKYLKPESGTLVFSEFVIIPVMMGLISAWFWRTLHLGSIKSWIYSLYSCIIAILLSAIFLGEGIICLIIVSPLIWVFTATGLFIGQQIFKRNNNTLNVSVFTLLLLIFFSDSMATHHYENEVSDQIVVNATPGKIWKNVVAFEPIKQRNGFWLFNIGLPRPMQTTVTGYYKGAGRKCIFSNGYVFGERIMTYDQNKDLTFDIIDQPRDPEIMGHIDIERGQFLLHDNGNGTTTLIGNSWYKLYVFPVWYYDLWTKSIVRNVHLRVMDHIKQLSEKN